MSDQTSKLFIKHPGNPVLGPGLGTVFDVSVLKEKTLFKMWFSYRDKHVISYAESKDGVNWRVFPEPAISPTPRTCDNDDVDRPGVIYHQGEYHMWYTAHMDKTSCLCKAVSSNCLNWKKYSNNPIMTPEMEWEKRSIMCPCVLRDEGKTIYKMWYSAGDHYEPDAVGYATSVDGISWKKSPDNPVFRPADGWEKDRVAGMHIVKLDGIYYGFYIGFGEGYEKSSIGCAKSRNGITNWIRHPQNPLISAGKPGDWDDCNIYKPYVIYEDGKWFLWYNASRVSDRREQIGFAWCDNLGF